MGSKNEFQTSRGGFLVLASLDLVISKSWVTLASTSATTRAQKRRCSNIAPTYGPTLQRQSPPTPASPPPTDSPTAPPPTPRCCSSSLTMPWRRRLLLSPPPLRRRQARDVPPRPSRSPSARRGGASVPAAALRRRPQRHRLLHPLGRGRARGGGRVTRSGSPSSRGW